MLLAHQYDLPDWEAAKRWIEEEKVMAAWSGAAFGLGIASR